MPHRLLHRLRRTLTRDNLLPAGSRVIAGVSGGSDSVALAVLLVELAVHGEFSVAGLAHLNHQLRETAGRDEEACRALAQALGLELVVERIDVRSYAGHERLSIEDAARRVRYDFLGRAAAGLGADRIAVGHTQDDQAETFLLKLIRGAGPTGLGGIYPRKGMVVRPLLDVSRADLRDYLARRGVGWVEDETNSDLSNPRNRIRHSVIPELDRALGGSVRPALARAADLVREDSAWLDELAGVIYREVCEGNDEDYGQAEGGRDRPAATSAPAPTPAARTAGRHLRIDVRRLSAEPLPIVRRVLLMALRRIAGGREVSLEHVQSAGRVLAGACTGTDVPGGRVELQREKLVLSQRGLPASDTLTGS